MLRILDLPKRRQEKKKGNTEQVAQKKIREGW